jgi:hypothetical protein
MSPLPSGFSTGVSGLTTVEQLLVYAIGQVLAAGDNSQAFVDEVSNLSTRAAQLFPLQVSNGTTDWQVIVRISLLLPNNWAGSPNRLWTLVSPIGATTNVPSSFQAPSQLGLTNWERVCAWSGLALQATFPDIPAPEGGQVGLRAITANIYPVEFSAIKSFRLIVRASFPLGANWTSAGVWQATQPLGSAAINPAFI